MTGVNRAGVRRSLPVLALLTCALGCAPVPPDAGDVEGAARSAEVVVARTSSRRAAAAALGEGAGGERKQILFGDLHVHSTFSVDAFLYGLPLLGGEGAHPPADACDFARHCAGLDFFSINDHAEGLTPALWTETKESIRACNARTDPTNPDLVALVGWEWTQIGSTPENHYGHKNVIFPGLADDELPARPISSISVETYDATPPPSWAVRAGGRLVSSVGYQPYGDFLEYMAQMVATPDCPLGYTVRELPSDCRESVPCPAELFSRLSDWGFDTLVIPHGLAWGIHAPPGTSLAVQLSSEQHDPAMQRLVEISSGHGNSEEYRPLPEFVVDEAGERICPEPTADFLPCCWQAGEIMRARCGDLPQGECERRVELARRYALDAGVNPQLVFPGSNADDWLDCDQCRDCFKPAMTLRPQLTAQFGAALANFADADADGRPLRFRWGFISSTDNHSSRPGTGYKQYARPRMTDSRGISGRETRERVHGALGFAVEDPQMPVAVPESRAIDLFETERKASYLYTGGLVAVHADGRDRRSVWDALQRREVYGTSGPRILLWFDLENGPRGRVPMGGEVVLDEAPRFVARAAGAFVQKPGCPADVRAGLSPDRLERLCLNECYHPGDRRHRITAIEVVRIRPQASPEDDPAAGIEDPWRTFPCEDTGEGCRVEFTDPDFATSGRDTVYYVRALQEETPAINGAMMRPRRDETGRVVGVDPCHGDERTAVDDDCLAPVQERAWSSPIYVDRTRGQVK